MPACCVASRTSIRTGFVLADAPSFWITGSASLIAMSTPGPRRRRAFARLSPARLADALAGCSALAINLHPFPARADSATAYCVLSRHDHTIPIEQGACQWSQRQGNASIRFKGWAFEFPSAEEGKTYTRLNRAGAEAGPVFTREGKYTLSVYWRKPAREPGGQ